MISKIKYFFSKDNPRLELISDIVFLIYLAWVTIPFISVRIPFLFRLTSGSNIAIVYRAIGSIIFAGFYLAVMLVNKHKLNKTYLIFSVALVLANILGTLILPSSVVYGDGTIYADGYVSNTHYFHISEYSIGLLSIVKGFIRLVFGLAFGYILLFVLPEVSGKKIIFKVTVIYVVLLIMSCILSFALEFNKFKINQILNLNLQSIFASKNDFGSFLVIGILSCLYIIKSKPKHYMFCYIPFFLFSLFSIICGCKTSLLFSIIAIIYIMFYFLKKLKRINSRLYLVLKSVLIFIIILLFLFFILLISGAIPLFSNLKNELDFIILHDIGYTLSTRLQIWTLSFKNTSFFKVLFGQTWSFGPQYLYASTSYYIGTGFSSYHNSLVCIYSLSGLLGLVFYLLILINCFRISYNNSKNGNLSFFILLVLGLVIFSFVEDDPIFISGSGFSLFYSLLLSPVGKVRINYKNYFKEIRI